MTDHRDLAQVLADARGDAQVMRRNGFVPIAESIELLCDDVQHSAGEYLDWLEEAEAALFSGRSRRHLATHFARWERRGHARKLKGHRYYRRVVLEQKARPTQAFLDGAAEAAREKSA